MTFVNFPNEMPPIYAYGEDDRPEQVEGSCPFTQENLARRLRRYLNGYIKSVSVLEHAPTTGTHHLHVYVQFDQTTTISLALLLAICGWPCHMSKANINFIDYFEDNADQANPNVHYDETTRAEIRREIEEYKAEEKKISERVYEALQTDTVMNVADQFKGFATMNMQKMVQVRNEIEKRDAALAQEASLIGYKRLELVGLKGSDLPLAKFLNAAMQTNPDGTCILGKKRHLWIWGETNMGKTLLKKALEQQVLCYDWAYEPAKWQDRYDPNRKYRIIFLDEFKKDIKTCGFSSAAEFNTFLDGDNWVLRRHVGPVQRGDKASVIVITNSMPADYFEDEPLEVRQALFGRFYEVQINKFIDLWPELRPPQQFEIANFYDNEDPFVKVRAKGKKDMIVLREVKVEGEKEVQQVRYKMTSREDPVIISSDEESSNAMDIDAHDD